ncbi:MAG: tetratricopeptide repeat protein, partial [Sphingomonadales bacterium]|nr:tetratricopeptide repeat protein [Sphingomonadales bacterium]
LAGLVQANLGLNKLVDAKAILDIIPTDKANDPAALGARAAYDLAVENEDAGEVDELEAKVKSHPEDLNARFELAKALSAHNQRDEAAENLLEIIRRDREWNDEAARKQLVKLFEAAGPTDPFTVNTRKQLSSILFS